MSTSDNSSGRPVRRMTQAKKDELRLIRRALREYRREMAQIDAEVMQERKGNADALFVPPVGDDVPL